MTKSKHTPFAIVLFTALALACPFELNAAKSANDDTVYETTQVDKTPSSVSQRATPMYPYSLKRDNSLCTTGIEFIVDTKGKTQDIKAIYWSDSAWRDSCIKAVSQWKYKPALKDGAPVKCRMFIPIDGNLGESECRESVVDNTMCDKRPQSKGHKPYAVFPSKLWKQKCGAKLSYVVGADGKVRDIKILSTTNDAYAQIIEKAVSKWQYTPAQKNGEPVDCPMVLTHYSDWQ